jgi:trehalose-phosphatase
VKDLWISWSRLAPRIARAEEIAMIIDFDGTLSPLASRPSRARLPGSLKAALLRLNGITRCHLMILSGRRIEDVRARVGIRSFFYGGNHGLELAGPGLSFIHPEARRLKPLVREIAGAARGVMRGLEGVLVEDKGLSLSLHYRRVPGPSLAPFRRRLLRMKEETAKGPFLWRRGHKVWELVPRVGWDKGKAARLFLDHLGAPFAVGIGDDATDEDLFRAIRGRGLSIRTDPRAGSVAQYALRGQDDTHRFLERAADLLRNGGVS